MLQLFLEPAVHLTDLSSVEVDHLLIGLDRLVLLVHWVLNLVSKSGLDLSIYLGGCVLKVQKTALQLVDVLEQHVKVDIGLPVFAAADNLLDPMTLKGFPSSFITIRFKSMAVNSSLGGFRSTTLAKP